MASAGSHNPAFLACGPPRPIRIAARAWRVIAAHARAAYPEECCGALAGLHHPAGKFVRRALPLINSAPHGRRDRYQVRPQDLLEADRHARRSGLDLIGLYHSHPDTDASLSTCDLANACPWFSFLVLSVRRGRLDRAASWVLGPDARAIRQTLVVPRPARR